MNRILAALSAVAAAATAQAGVVITMGPGNFPGDENVLFNGSGLISQGPLVQGRTNQTDRIVNFWDAGEDLETPPNGQARIDAMDEEFTALRIAFNDPMLMIGTLIMNIDPTEDGEVTFSIDTNEGTHTETFELDGSGQNFVMIEATNGTQIDSVYFTTDVPVADVKQVRIGAFVVPEPTSLGAAALGLAGLMFRRRRR